jgi:DNA (cytosine-5)-methyltransferase 1
MKVLNLYSGIGGNRNLWQDVEVTAVEINPDIAKIYQDFFPDDTVIVADAHQYLLDHYKEFDFIWSSPPCPTHSRVNLFTISNGSKKAVYPDMKLYQEIIFLNQFYKGKWLVENVISYYQPLIRPNQIARHWFWSNFFIYQFKSMNEKIENSKIADLQDRLKIDISNFKIKDKRVLLRNCVQPELGLHIFNSMNNQNLRLAI